LILVDDHGENQIAVAPGANDSMEAHLVRDALARSMPTVVLASFEVPAAAVTEAADWCRERDIAFVLNPAPMKAALVRDLQDRVAYLIPNQHELERLGDESFAGVVIETRGSDGVIIHGRDRNEHVATSTVDAVDTTGAGDCFCGVFAAGLAEGRPVPEAVERAVVAAAMSVRVAGAREGMPHRQQIDEGLSGRPVGDAQRSGTHDATQH
jgi:ribokinase